MVKGGGGDGTKKIKKTYKLSFFLQKGAGTESTRLAGTTLNYNMGGGGPVPPVSLSGPCRGLHGTCSRASTLFSTVVVVQSQWQI